MKRAYGGPVRAGYRKVSWEDVSRLSCSSGAGPEVSVEHRIFASVTDYVSYGRRILACRVRRAAFIWHDADDVRGSVGKRRGYLRSDWE